LARPSFCAAARFKGFSALPVNLAVPHRLPGAEHTKDGPVVLDWPTLIFFPVLMAYAAVSDILTMTIANRVSIALVAGFVGLAAWAGVPWQVIAINHLACGCAVLVLTFALFAFGWIGGGDAKLAAATAVWFGWSDLADYGLLTSVLGAGLTLLILQFRRFALTGFWNRQAWLARLHENGAGVPYGVALAAAGLILYPATPLWQKIAGL
jgi:prepilin peptidase CpaA